MANTHHKLDPGAIWRMLRDNDSARMKLWRKMCMSCGMCAETCHFYLSFDRASEFMPAYKAISTIGVMFKKDGKVDQEFLEECVEVLWGRCTLCKRCTQFCPFGIDIAGIIHLGRRICRLSGVAPDEIWAIDKNYDETDNQMGFSFEEYKDTLEWMAEESEDVVKGLVIPIDKRGAKIMYTINPREAKYYPQEIAMAAQIFHVAGEDWTMPSKGWDCTNLPMFSGSMDLAAKMVRNMYEAARELEVDKICLTECGHALRSAKFEGPYWVGVPGGRPPVEIIHPVQLYYQYVRDGRITLDPAKKLTEPVTYQDPCNISRSGGLWKEARGLLVYFAQDFREMTPTKDLNFCCGGGAGLIPMGGRWRTIRIKAGQVKADQIRATGAKTVITPCHNCHDQISDLNREYQLGVKVMYLKDYLCEAMIIPDDLKPKED